MELLDLKKPTGIISTPMDIEDIEKIISQTEFEPTVIELFDYIPLIHIENNSTKEELDKTFSKLRTYVEENQIKINYENTK